MANSVHFTLVRMRRMRRTSALGGREVPGALGGASRMAILREHLQMGTCPTSSSMFTSLFTSNMEVWWGLNQSWSSTSNPGNSRTDLTVRLQLSNWWEIKAIDLAAGRKIHLFCKHFCQGSQCIYLEILVSCLDSQNLKVQVIPGLFLGGTPSLWVPVSCMYEQCWSEDVTRTSSVKSHMP